jgi:hypothetical protein
MDLDSIAAGLDFAEVIESAVHSRVLASETGGMEAKPGQVTAPGSGSGPWGALARQRPNLLPWTTSLAGGAVIVTGAL